jgi:Ca2+-binding EF-hand superfamily protein
MTEAVVNAFKVSEEELRGYRECFVVCDEDGDRKLNRAEMQIFLTETGLGTNLLDLAFIVFDKDKSGLLDFEEFVECILFLQLSADDFPLYIRRLFEAFDADKSGKLDSKELLRFLKVAQVKNPEEWANYTMAQTQGGPVPVEKLIEVLQMRRNLK